MQSVGWQEALETMLLMTSSTTQLIHCVSVMCGSDIIVTTHLADQSFQVAAT